MNFKTLKVVTSHVKVMPFKTRTVKDMIIHVICLNSQSRITKTPSKVNTFYTDK